MSGYTYDIEPGSRTGIWQWQITDPYGNPNAWGASARNKRDLDASLKKTVSRLNKGLGNWKKNSQQVSINPTATP